MRLGLRWKIMFFTVLPLVALAFATLWVVNRSISRQTDRVLHDDLGRASAVLENLLGASEQSLEVAGQVIVKDPRFFSVLTIPGTHRDLQLRATVAGVARDFNTITQADLFEVTDAEGHLLAAVGRDASAEEARAPLVREALSGRAVTRVLVQPQAHHMVSVSPVLAGGRVVGALILGTRIGEELAQRLRLLTRSEVTFLSRDAITGSTLDNAADRAAALAAVARLRDSAIPDVQGGTFLRIRGAEHRYLTIVRPLPRSEPGQGQWYLMQRALDLEAAFLREMQTGLVELGIAAVLVALLAGFLIAERITSPVLRLVRGAEEMERGNFDYPVDARSRDEIGVLASSFDDMRKRQREYIHSLKEVARIKSEFINVASHELRTPVSIIRGFQELMLNGSLGELNAQQRQAVEASLRGVSTLTRIAEDATRVAQIEGERLALRLAEHDVAALVDEAIAAAKALGADRDVTISRDVPARIGTARVDPARLAQALGHLVSNGIRFTPDGGRVQVKARREANDLLLEVSDTGVGIEPERQARLFERSSGMRDSLHHHSSSTLEFNSAGLGLGLSIARGIVEAHGGRIAVMSAPGAGSIFTIRVPATAADGLARAA
jgi:signal transduction histidine kinase